MKKEEIKRMNDLYHLSQERDLSEEEFAEWEGLKKQYVADFKASLTAQLDNTTKATSASSKRSRATSNLRGHKNERVILCFAEIAENSSKTDSRSAHIAANR